MASRTGAIESHEPSPARIECHTDLRAFFHETLTRALASRRVDAPQHTEHYLVSLLAWLGHDTAPLSRSLVELELAAKEGPREDRLEHLRTLGDQALSVASLFEAQLERHGISRAYVADVGARAYRNAGQLASASRRVRAQAEVFLDLGTRFATYAEVLEQVRESTALGTPDDVLALYERYVRTHSPTLLERLHAHGVLSVADAPEETELVS